MSNFDWSKCIFCQREIAKVRTVCPSGSKRTDVGCGYATLATAVRGFSEIGELPSGINIEAWDEGAALRLPVGGGVHVGMRRVGRCCMELNLIAYGPNCRLSAQLTLIAHRRLLRRALIVMCPENFLVLRVRLLPSPV